MSDFTFAAGFIGAGNMGGALAQAALSAVPADRIAVICHTPEHTRAAAARLGCPAGDSNAALAATSRFLFLGVKPGMIRELATEISSSVSPGTVLVSMLAGVSLSRLEELFGADRPILRILRHRAGCHPVRPQRARDGGGYSRIPHPDGGGGAY